MPEQVDAKAAKAKALAHIKVYVTPYADPDNRQLVLGLPDDDHDARIRLAAQTGVPMLIDVIRGLAEVPPFQIQLANHGVYPEAPAPLNNEYIRFAPKEVLSTPADAVTEDDLKDPKFHQKVLSMVPMMYFARGVGLAAPQIGWRKRVCIIDAEFYKSGHVGDLIKPKLFINPVILDKRDERHIEEGCLSVPRFMGLMNRALTVRVRYLTPTGVEREEELTGREAHIIQHEVDHLDGKTLYDQMKPGVSRIMYRERMRKIEKKRLRRANKR